VTTIRGVTIQLTPDSVAEGFYTYDGETVTMVKRDGSPADIDDEPVTEASHPDHVTTVARRLTRKIRKSLMGGTPEGFGAGESVRYRGIDPLPYPNSGIA
jgi:hypothetical protein